MQALFTRVLYVLKGQLRHPVASQSSHSWLQQKVEGLEDYLKPDLHGHSSAGRFWRLEFELHEVQITLLSFSMQLLHWEGHGWQSPLVRYWKSGQVHTPSLFTRVALSHKQELSTRLVFGGQLVQPYLLQVRHSTHFTHDMFFTFPRYYA